VECHEIGYFCRVEGQLTMTVIGVAVADIWDLALARNRCPSLVRLRMPVLYPNGRRPMQERGRVESRPPSTRPLPTDGREHVEAERHEDDILEAEEH
jgi:hypothetical protein